MQKSILARAAEFAYGIKFEDLPPKLVGLAKTALIDYAGVCVAGSSEPSAKAALKYCLQNSVKKEASVFGSGETADAKYAAFANAVSAHALDFDDVSWSTIGHPTCVTMPVCFALCEKLSLSGKELILEQGEVFVYQLLSENTFECLVSDSKNFKPGSKVQISGTIFLESQEFTENGIKFQIH